MSIQIGQTVLYRLTEQDAEAINRRYADATANIYKMREDKTGYMAHIGNQVEMGETVAAMCVKIWSDTMANLHVFLDGSDSLWATSIEEGPDDGQWLFRPGGAR